MGTPHERRRTLRDVGEFGLIDLIAAALGRRAAPSRDVVGIGDDAAVWRPSPDTSTIITTDTMVQDVHFRFETIGWRDLGWKALAMNVSDVAAMGGRPRYAVVTFGGPACTPVEDVLALYEGMGELVERFGVAIIGGDTVSSPIVVVSVTVVGETLPRRDGHDPPLLRRAAARPGDRIYVTGYLGAAAAGLELLERRDPIDDPAREALVRAHTRPAPRVPEAIYLLEHGVSAGADNSDGLVRQVLLFCQQSRVGAVVDARLLPVDPNVLAVFPDRATELALHGGESYELVLAAPPDVVERLRPGWQATFGLPLTEVGRVADEPGLALLDEAGRPIPLERAGFDHFAIASGA